MKKIVKVALVALLGVYGFNANAQDLGITVKAGMNLNSTSVSIKNMPGTLTTSNNTGFHIGASYELPVADIIFVEGGLFFDTRGYKINWVDENAYRKNEENVKGNLYSLNIPVTAKVKFGVADDARVFLQAGLFANVLLSGKEKFDDSYTTKTTNQTEKESKTSDIKFGKYKDEAGEEREGLNRFDYGLTFGGGVEYKNFVLSLGYDLGFPDLHGDKDVTQKFSAIKIGLGYKF